MVAGTGEAPCGIVAYESVGLPAEYRGNLLVTSWGDHLVERYQLTPRGASFTSQAQVLVRGGEDFRPVGMAVAPDGSIYVSDWVDKAYPVHGKGRIWRIRLKHPSAADGLCPSQVRSLGKEKLQGLLSDRRREIRAAAGAALAAEHPDLLRRALVNEKESRARLQALWAALSSGTHEGLGAALDDRDTDVRGEAARLLPVEDARLLQIVRGDSPPFVRLQAISRLRIDAGLGELASVLGEDDPFLVGAALSSLGRRGNAPLLIPFGRSSNPKVRLGILLALRRTGDERGRELIPTFLGDADPAVRRAAIQWVGEERLAKWAPLLTGAASRPPVTRELFEALLASRDFLAGTRRNASEEPSGEDFVAKIVQDAAQPPGLRAVALRMLRPDHPSLNAALLKRLFEGADKQLGQEALRTLVLRADDASQDILRRLAADRAAGHDLRAEAVMGLGQSTGTSSATRGLLVELLHEGGWERDALRSLRGATGRPEIERAVLDWWAKERATKKRAPQESDEIAAQIALVIGASRPGETSNPAKMPDLRIGLGAPGDAKAGERVFFHVSGPRCFACHRVDGRGSSIGPDLSNAGRSMSRDKIIESILQPSKEIAPQFVSWQVVSRDGKVHTGMIVEEGPNSTITLADAQGRLEIINRNDVEERHALRTSIMPENLAQLMTVQEYRDLLAFLTSRK
jgi:putative heme-binding domain-containing protein